MPAPKKPAGTKQDRRPQRAEIGNSLELVQGDVDALVPPAPDELEEESLQVWASYWLSPAAKFALDVDRLGVATRWIEAIDERRKALRLFKKQRFVEGSTGQPTLNPIATWIKSREEVIAKCEGELGLTPYARQRLGIAAGQAALTAEQLNRMTEGPAHASDHGQDIIDAEILDEFEAAD